MAPATNRQGARPWHFVVLLALAALVLGGLPAVAAAQTSPELPAALPGDRLLLTEHTDAADQVWSAALDGSDRRLLSDGSADFAPRWSPDGSAIAFHRLGTSRNEIWVMRADGTEARRVAPAGYEPSWSPDGRSLVFATSLAGAPGPLQIVAVASGEVRDVPGTEGGVDPSWSPDGSSLVFTLIEQEAVQASVATVRTDGGGLHATTVEALTGPPVWSPDGRVVAFAAAPAGRAFGVHTVRRDGSGLRLVHEVEGGTSAQPVRALAWSPAGDRIAFSAPAPDGRSEDVYVVGADGSALERPAPSEADDRVAGWTADGHAIVFTRAEVAGQPHSDRDAWLLPLAEAPATQRITTTGRSVVADVGPGLALRVAGADRIATAVQLSGLRAQADTVVLARADAYPDALTGAPLAAALDAPILLTGRAGLDARVAEEIRRLGASSAHLLGGEGALSAAVAQDLRDLGIGTVERLGGSDRFATAQRVAAAVLAQTGADGAYVVEGASADAARGWPDAVAVSGLAGLEGRPILLVTRDTLPPATSAAVTELDLERLTVVGGTGAVSAGVAAALDAVVDDVDRVAGSTRYGTSAALAERALAAGGSDARPWLTTGRNWPDALAAGPAVAADGGVLLLIDGHGLAGSPASRDRLAAAGVDRAVLVGGAGVLHPATAAEVERLAAGRAETARVSVFFGREDGEDPREVVGLPRYVEAPGVLHGAIEALLRGPTPAERSAGHWSWFSGDTAGMLNDVRIEGTTALVDFADFSEVIPNASTSAGSAALLAQLDATATQFPTVESARYSFDGDRAAFYTWLQLVVPTD